MNLESTRQRPTDLLAPRSGAVLRGGGGFGVPRSIPSWPTRAFCARYDSRWTSANCVVVAGKRGGEPDGRCVVLATTADINGLVRKH